jgi:hypothetical protein
LAGDLQDEMYPGVLILEVTDSEVLAASRRRTLKGINTPMGTSTLKGINAVLRRDRGQAAAPTGGFCNDWVNSASSPSTQLSGRVS